MVNNINSTRSQPNGQIDVNAVSALLGPLGPLCSTLPGFEERPGQQVMATETARALNDNNILLVEAGTGVGKSIAYLIPAILWAVSNKERVVISTRTINLQEQLLQKDIPLLKKTMDVDFKSVLIKGRSNYICLRKLRDIEKEPSLYAEFSRSADALVNWANETQDGTLSELAAIPEPELWNKVSSHNDTCIRTKCQYYRDCFFFTARRTAASADILIANHHLLFADLAIKRAKTDYDQGAVMPPFRRLIIDEAHSMEETATTYFAGKVNSAGMLRQISRLRNIKDPAKGLLPSIALKAKKSHLNLGRIYERITEDIGGHCLDLHLVANEAFEALYYYFLSTLGADENVTRFRINTGAGQKSPDGLPVAEVDDLIEKLTSFCRDIDNITDDLFDVMKTEKEFEDLLLARVIETRAISKGLATMAVLLRSIIFGEGDGEVRWVELKRQGRTKRMQITLNLSPLHMGEAFNETLYTKMDTLIMSSATLAVKKKFDFFKGRVGLDLLEDKESREIIVESPFDYRSQVELILAKDIEEPTSPEFPERLASLIPQIVSSTKGGVLILFTSYALLNRVFNDTEKILTDNGTKVLRQGSSARHTLLNDFKSDTNSVLFATDSFWQGIDVPGAALSAVVITRLPFEVPTDPITQARHEELLKRGLNPFMELSLPSAVIRFRQGFGRLIRKTTDRGRVYVLDKRISSSRYGKSFIDSLPECVIKDLTP